MTQTTPFNKDSAGTDSSSAAAKLVHTIIRFRMVILIASCVVLASVLAGFIFQYINERKIEESSDIATEMQQAYFRWINADDVTEKDRQLDLFHDARTIAEKRYTKLYTGRLAGFLHAQVMYNQRKFSDAAVMFNSLIQKPEEADHISSMSAMNAAVAFEQAGDIDAAIQAYKKVFSDFGSVSPDAPRALFSVGRLLEERSSADAIEAYEQLINEYPVSDWLGMAENRIIFLQTLGE